MDKFIILISEIVLVSLFVVDAFALERYSILFVVYFVVAFQLPLER
jgi:hypothetical protein